MVKDGSNEKMLLYGVENNNIEIVKTALNAGADVETKDELGWTALVLALRRNHIEVARYLLAAGADPDVRDNWGCTLLYETRFVAIAELLIIAGTDMETRNKFGDTPAEYHRKHGRPNVADCIERYLAERKNAELVRGIEDVEIHDMSRWL